MKWPASKPTGQAAASKSEAGMAYKRRGGMKQGAAWASTRCRPAESYRPLHRRIGDADIGEASKLMATGGMRIHELLVEALAETIISDVTKSSSSNPHLLSCLSSALFTPAAGPTLIASAPVRRHCTPWRARPGELIIRGDGGDVWAVGAHRRHRHAAASTSIAAGRGRHHGAGGVSISAASLKSHRAERRRAASDAAWRLLKLPARRNDADAILTRRPRHDRVSAWRAAGRGAGIAARNALTLLQKRVALGGTIISGRLESWPWPAIASNALAWQMPTITSKREISARWHVRLALVIACRNYGRAALSTRRIELIPDRQSPASLPASEISPIIIGRRALPLCEQRKADDTQSGTAVL